MARRLNNNLFCCFNPKEGESSFSYYIQFFQLTLRFWAYYILVMTREKKTIKPYSIISPANILLLLRNIIYTYIPKTHDLYNISSQGLSNYELHAMTSALLSTLCHRRIHLMFYPIKEGLVYLEVTNSRNWNYHT